jgi:hypothetical protein
MVEIRQLEKHVGDQRASLADFSLAITQGNAEQFSWLYGTSNLF